MLKSFVIHDLGKTSGEESFNILAKTPQDAVIIAYLEHTLKISGDINLRKFDNLVIIGESISCGDLFTHS